MGGSSKSGKDNSAKLYAEQQEQLAREKAETAASEQAARDEELRRQEELRTQMLAQRNVLGSEEDEEAAVLRLGVG